MPVGSSSGVAKPVAKAPAAANSGQNGSAQAGDFTDFLKMVAKSPALITGYSKILKTAGYYKGKITGKYTPALQRAFTNVETDRLSISAVNPISRDDFFKQLEPIGAGGSGPTTVTSITKFTPDKAKELINAVIQDSLGRKATAAEIKKYTASLKGIEKKASTVTKYGTGSNQTQVTTPGISEQQYLIDQVAGTDEGKANKVLGFYETFMNALGGN